MSTVAATGGPRFQLKFVPLLVTVGLTVFVVFGSGMLSVVSARLFHTALPQQSLVKCTAVQHGFQLALDLIVVAVLKLRFLRADRFSMNWAGVIVAVMFALQHATSLFKVGWLLALGQQIYAFILGVLYAYWLEKSHGIVAPMIGHGRSDLLETLRVFACLGLL